MRQDGVGEPQLPNRNEIEKPLLRLLIRLGGSVDLSKVGRRLEIGLAEEFSLTESERDFAALNYHSKGHRKWRNHIQFVRDDLVKKGEIDNTIRSKWTVTELGYRRVGMQKP